MALSGDAAKALEAVKTGQDIGQVLGGGSDTSRNLEDEGIVRADSSSDDSILRIGDQEASETSEDPSAQESTQEALRRMGQKVAADSKVAEKSTTKKKLPVDKGKGSIDVDYSNRDEIDKAFLMAHGARKWQAERDQAKRQLSEVSTKHEQLSTHWNSLEQAYQKNGVAGVVDLLEGRQGAYQSQVQAQIERQKFLEGASPEEKQLLEVRELAEQRDRELAKMRKENEDFRKNMETERETAELRSLESKVHPPFEKYRFKGRLGDENDEHMFDEMLWNTALKRLEPYEEKGVDISPELIEREFRTVAQSLRKRVGVQADKAVSKVVERKKTEATEHAQAKAMSGFRNSTTAQEAENLISSGNLSSLLKGWGKYGGLFQGKK